VKYLCFFGDFTTGSGTVVLFAEVLEIYDQFARDKPQQEDET
jgi:hypothetical protein